MMVVGCRRCHMSSGNGLARCLGCCQCLCLCLCLCCGSRLIVLCCQVAQTSSNVALKVIASLHQIPVDLGFCQRICLLKLVQFNNALLCLISCANLFKDGCQCHIEVLVGKRVVVAAVRFVNLHGLRVVAAMDRWRG